MESGHVQHQPAGPAGIAAPLELRVYLIAHVAVVVCVEIVPDADADFSNGNALRQDVVIVEGEQRPSARSRICSTMSPPSIRLKRS